MRRRRNVTPIHRHPYWGRQPRRRRRSWIWGPRQLLTGVVVVSAVGLVGLTWVSSGANVPEHWDGQTVIVSWVDGDSGTLNGREFRLHGVDAPEGSPSRALCATERELSSDARQAARRATDNRRVLVTQSYGFDRYGRELVRLSADGRDVATTLIGSGHLKRWNFEAGQAKPDWCR